MTRVAVIEKWVAVADICRCLHNYNAVLEITSSLNRSSVFRLKKTWLKVSKQVPYMEAFIQMGANCKLWVDTISKVLKSDPTCLTISQTDISSKGIAK